MELKVWVEGIQRVVCGVCERTTCQVRVPISLFFRPAVTHASDDRARRLTRFGLFLLERFFLSKNLALLTEKNLKNSHYFEYLVKREKVLNTS